jgi:hypothetical protein
MGYIDKLLLGSLLWARLTCAEDVERSSSSIHLTILSFSVDAPRYRNLVYRDLTNLTLGTTITVDTRDQPLLMDERGWLVRAVEHRRDSFQKWQSFLSGGVDVASDSNDFRRCALLARNSRGVIKDVALSMLQTNKKWKEVKGDELRLFLSTVCIDSTKEAPVWTTLTTQPFRLPIKLQEKLSSLQDEP